MLYDKKWDKKVPVKGLEPWQHHLLNAAQYIRAYGWCQGAYQNGDKMCVLGALRAITGSKQERYQAIVMFERFVNGPVAAWNDAPNRTKEEVIAVLETVAKQEV